MPGEPQPEPIEAAALVSTVARLIDPDAERIRKIACEIAERVDQRLDAPVMPERVRKAFLDAVCEILHRNFASALRAQTAFKKLRQNRLSLIHVHHFSAWRVLDEFGKELQFHSDPVRAVLEAAEKKGESDA